MITQMIVQIRIFTILLSKIQIQFQRKQQMSRVKAWRQLNHVKGEQFKDTQSVISQQKSSSSYQFNKFRFSKSKIQDEVGSTKNFGLASILKAKQRSRQHSILNLNDSKIRSRQNSFAQMLDRQPVRLSSKNPQNRKFQMKVKRFMLQIRRIHDELGHIAESLLTHFQKIKQQMQVNLLKVTDQLLKMSKDVKQISLIHQIVQKGFSSIRKNIAILPSSLARLNKVSQSQILKKKTVATPQPLTPTLSPSHRQSFSKYKPKFDSIFSPKEKSLLTTKNIERPQLKELGLVQKARPQTQRKRISVVSPFNQFDDSPGPTPERNQEWNADPAQHQSTRQIGWIIRQMRGILDQ